MTTAVEELASKVRALPQAELDQFLTWLAEYQAGRLDDWDEQIERDSQPGGALQATLDRVRRDIAAGRTKPLDEVLGNS
jgi:hypothetical protein